MQPDCLHADAIAEVAAPLEVCEMCVEIGGEWVHLRQCMTCGRTLCCNDSPNRHMTRHWEEIGHPVMRGASPGEGWMWCFADETMVRATPAGLETYDPYVEAGTHLAAGYLRAGGTLDPEEGYLTQHGFPLGEWFAYVRELKTDGELRQRDVEAIEALPGWRW